MPNGYIKSKNGTPIELVDAYAREQLDLKVDIIQDVSDKGKVLAVGETGNVELVDINNGNADWYAKENENGYILNRPFYDDREILFDSNDFDINNADAFYSGNVTFYRIMDYIPYDDFLNIEMMSDESDDIFKASELELPYLDLENNDDGFYFSNILGMIGVPTDDYTYSQYELHFDHSGFYVAEFYLSSGLCIGSNLNEVKKIDKKFIPIVDSKFSILKDSEYDFKYFKNGIYFVESKDAYIINGEARIRFSHGAIIIIHSNDIARKRLVGVAYSSVDDGIFSYFKFCLTEYDCDIKHYIYGDHIYHLESIVEPSEDDEEWKWDDYWNRRECIPTAGAVKDYVDSYLPSSGDNEPFIIEITKHYDSETKGYIIDSIDKTYEELINALDSGKVTYLKDGISFYKFMFRSANFVEFGGVSQPMKYSTNGFAMGIINFRVSKDSTCSIMCNDIGLFLTQSEILSKSNTLTYTPTSDYHPATKKYVDDLVYDDTDVKSRLETLEEKFEFDSDNSYLSIEIVSDFPESDIKKNTLYVKYSGNQSNVSDVEKLDIVTLDDLILSGYDYDWYFYANGEWIKLIDIDVSSNDFTDDYKNRIDTLTDEHINGLIDNKIPQNIVTYANNTVNVVGNTKTVSKLSTDAIYVSNGIIMGGTAQEAGLVTRGICGVTTPTSTGGATKENLYINFDGNNTYSSSRQVVLQASAVGTHYGNNLYQYCAARGDAVKGWVEAQGFAKSSAIPTVTNDFTDAYKNRLDALTDEYILSLLPKYDGGVE